MMGGLATPAARATFFGTVTASGDIAFALASVKAAGDLGREVADLATLMFGAVLPLHVRVIAEASLSDALPDLFADWHGMQDEDRAYLGRVAAMVFDRRLALHAAASVGFGGAE